MEAETLKLGIIDRVMKTQNPITLRKMEELMIQAELEFRAEESLDAISKGEEYSLTDFAKSNREWAKKHIV